MQYALLYMYHSDCIAISHIKICSSQEDQTLNPYGNGYFYRGHSLNSWESTMRQEACIEVKPYITALAFLKAVSFPTVILYPSIVADAFPSGIMIYI